MNKTSSSCAGCNQLHLPANRQPSINHPFGTHLLLAEAFEILTKSTDGSFQNGIASVFGFLCQKNCFDTPKIIQHPRHLSRNVKETRFHQVRFKSIGLVTLLSFISFHLLKIVDMRGKSHGMDETIVAMILNYPPGN